MKAYKATVLGSRRSSCAIGGRRWITRPLRSADTRGARRNFLFAPLDVAAGVVGRDDLGPSSFVLNYVKGGRDGSVTAAPGDDDGGVVGAAIVWIVHVFPPDMNLVAYVEEVGVHGT